MKAATGVLMWGVVMGCLMGVSWAQQTSMPLTEINTEATEKSPFLSSDGLTLYFSRHGYGPAYTRIFQADRLTPDGPFGNIQEVPGLIYTGGHVDYPWVSPDNLRLYYYRTEPGSARRLLVSERANTGQAWAAGTYISELNALGPVVTPTLAADELTIVFSGLDIAGGFGGYDLWIAQRGGLGAPFVDANNLAILNSTAHDYHPALSGDGLTLYFASNRSGTLKLYQSVRGSIVSPFSLPEEVVIPDVNATEFAFPGRGADNLGPVLHFSARETGGDWDIYQQHLAGVVEPNLPPGTFYVDGTNGSDLNTGKSVELAFATIQHALNVAQSGETVVVMDGTYTGPGNKELNFLGKAIYLTSQNGPSHTIIDCQSSGRAFFFHSGEQTDSVVDGFTLANGNSPVGGAIYCLFSGPTLKHLVLVNNYGANGGGAIRCEYGNNPPHVLNCTFYNNSTTGFGGGLYAGNGIQPQLTNCILWNNTAASGHQLAVINTTVSVSFCAVQGGQAGVLQQGGFAVWGDGNIENDPLIVAPNDLSVTLSSERGRYWPQYDLWVIDEQTSPCIDAGDPALNVANEPGPNGERINMGAHGSTAFASLSPIEEEECFQLDYNDDGLIELQDLFDMMEAWLDAWEAALIMPQTPS